MLPCKSAAVRLSVCLTGVQCTRWHCDTRYTDGRKTVRGEPVTSTRTQGLLQESQQTGEGTSTCNWRNCQHCLLHYVNLIVFTLLLAHLILRILPHHSHHLRSRHRSLPRPFTPDLKLISFTNPFFRSHSYSFRTDFTDLNLYWIKWALALFVLVSFSGYVC